MSWAKIALGIASAFLLACTNFVDAVIPSSVDTSTFDGQYKLDSKTSFRKQREEIQSEKDNSSRQNMEQLLLYEIDRYSNFRINRGIIRSGNGLVQELSLQTVTIEGGTLHGRAIWHEDIHDPGDSSEIDLTLRLVGNRLEFHWGLDKPESEDPIVFVKVKE